MTLATFLMLATGFLCLAAFALAAAWSVFIAPSIWRDMFGRGHRS